MKTQITNGKHNEVDETVKLIYDIDEHGIDNMDMEDYDYIIDLHSQLVEYVKHIDFTLNNLEGTDNLEEFEYWAEKKTLLNKYIPSVKSRAYKLLSLLQGESKVNERAV